jgi:SAM-dependent methyltransferase
MDEEIQRIVKTYHRRDADGLDARYSLTWPAVYMASQERERLLLKWIRFSGIAPASDKRLLEIGCGGGANLLWLLRAGFFPENLVGNELIPARIQAARNVLPARIRLLEGNALELDIPPDSFDIVFQSVVFTSILDAHLKSEIAAAMWKWVKPGGGVLWYDFVFDNPHNGDVKGIGKREIRALFPNGAMQSWRVTLAPPIARLVTRIHPSMYTILNSIPALRSHVLCWIKKGDNVVGHS